VNANVLQPKGLDFECLLEAHSAHRRVRVHHIPVRFEAALNGGERLALSGGGGQKALCVWCGVVCVWLQTDRCRCERSDKAKRIGGAEAEQAKSRAEQSRAEQSRAEGSSADLRQRLSVLSGYDHAIGAFESEHPIAHHTCVLRHSTQHHHNTSHHISEGRGRAEVGGEGGWGLTSLAMR
jgi:hypothetical protein